MRKMDRDLFCILLCIFHLTLEIPPYNILNNKVFTPMWMQGSSIYPIFVSRGTYKGNILFMGPCLFSLEFFSNPIYGL